MTLVKYSWNPLEDNIMAEYDGAGNLLARYTTEPELHGNVISQNRGGVTSYFHHDGNGNTVAVTNDDGDVTDTRAYNAFGETTESTGTTEFPFQFVGQKGYYRDKETGEYVVRRRIYTPNRVRWLSVDPIRMRFLGVQYTYVGNVPTQMVDPSGLWERCGGGCCEALPLEVVPNPAKCGIGTRKRDGKTERVFAAVFEVRATFLSGTNPDTKVKRDCSCCSYRQDIKGLIGFRVEGDFAPTAALDDNGKPLQWSDYVQDCITIKEKKYCYGDRDDPARANDVYYTNMQSEPDQKGGCNYYSKDIPSIPMDGVLQHRDARGKKVEFILNLHFRLSITDSCCVGPPGKLTLPSGPIEYRIDCKIEEVGTGPLDDSNDQMGSE